MDARQRLLHAKLIRIYGFLRDEDSPICPKNCPLERLRWMTKESGFSRGVQSPLVVEVDWVYYQSRVCNFCLLRAKEGFNSARQVLWKDLPSFFNLPAWDKLQSRVE